MKRVLTILIFLSDAIAAITKGAKICWDHWPVNNPFNRRSGSDVRLDEQQSEPDKSDGDQLEQVQESPKVSDSTS